MFETISIPVDDCSMAEYESPEELERSCRMLGCDGIEVIWGGNLAVDVLPESFTTGYHLNFYPDWLDFWGGDEAALMRKFGSREAYTAFYGGPDREALLSMYRRDLDRALSLGARYVVFHVSDVSLEEGYTYRWEHSDEDVIDASVELINLLFSEREYPLLLLVENQWWPGFTFTDPEKTARLMDGIRHPNKGIMLDTGHLMNANLDLETEAEGAAYIHRMLDAHGGLCRHIRGLHLHQSLSGSYVKANTGRLPSGLPADYVAQFSESYGHIMQIDRHQPWTDPSVAGIIERVRPEFLTHEFSGRNREEREHDATVQKETISKGGRGPERRTPVLNPCFEIRNLTFSYPQQEKETLQGVSLTVAPGQFVTLCGPSGCGKTTLLRQLKTVLAPHGRLSGEILFEGKPLSGLDQRDQSARIGFVMQNPDNQIVTDKVWHELAFGLESLGYDTSVIRGRVAEMSSFFGIQSWFYRNVSELSGGQKQLLNLASIMAMQPSVLILDEPTSQLDPIAAADFLATVGKINRELGTTVIMTEHRLEEVFPMSDRVLVMEEGRLICDGTPREVGENLKEFGHSMFLAMPAPMRIYAAVPNELDCPVTVRDGRMWLSDFAGEHPLGKVTPVPETESSGKIASASMPDGTGKTVLELKDIWFKYEKELPDVVKGLSLSVKEGDFLAILGGNGTGKTTALSLISGIHKPYRGKILMGGSDITGRNTAFDGLIGALPQNPQALFVKKTVREDLLEILKFRAISKEEKEKKLAFVSRLCRLEALQSRHPFDLSGGEQQRAALAKVLLLEPRILLLDEPTKGLDAEFKQVFAEILQTLLRRGVTVVMVSHDIEFCARYAHRCAMFFDGNIVTEDVPRTFFSGNSFYTTAANRMARHLLPDAVTAGDVILACGGILPPAPELPAEDDEEDENNAGGGKDREDSDDSSGDRIPLWRKVIAYLWSQPPIENQQVEQGMRTLSKRTAAASVMILLAIPLTIFIGVFYFGDRKYYFISLIVILETMIPFLLVFEGRKPQARELIIIAVLCAIGVAGRAAFFMLPHFKPVAAMVIIAGVAFGGETGFLVGAITMMVSNIMFGQGPWTPWQMFAMGIIGFLAGVLFQKGLLLRSRLPLCIFGGLATLVIYGGLMNPSAVLTYSANPTWPLFLAAYAVGLPVDLVHASATVFFLWLISRPMLEKLDRVKVKYGLVELEEIKLEPL